MTRLTSRREFLGRAAVASAIAAGGLAGVVNGRRAEAVEPVERAVEGPKYKFTLAGYSYRKLLTGQNPECTLEDFVREIVDEAVVER